MKLFLIFQSNYFSLETLSSVTQVLRFAVDSDVVDAAVKRLRGAIGAGAQP